MRLDGRLSLAFDLYDPCGLAADIGTDHAHLPAALLRGGKCREMILTDLSESALDNARETISRAGLTDRVRFRLGDGLAPLKEKCGMISILGMGGKTIRSILEEGKEHLAGATLLLSAHTDLPHVRRAVAGIGYRLVSETPCFAAGRYYLMLKAVPGAEQLTEQEIRLGKALFRSGSPALRPFLEKHLAVLAEKEKGLRTAACADPAALAQTEEDMAFLRAEIRRLPACAEGLKGLEG